MQAVLPITFMYQGPAEELERFSRPFRSLGPLTDVTTKDVPYPDLFRLAGNLESDAACQKNRNQVLFHARRNSLPATTLRQAYNVFDGVMRKYGDPLGGSALFVEGYSKQAVTAVTAVDDKSTAFPWRKDVFLVYVAVEDSAASVCVCVSWGERGKRLTRRCVAGQWTSLLQIPNKLKSSSGQGRR